MFFLVLYIYSIGQTLDDLTPEKTRMFCNLKWREDISLDVISSLYKLHMTAKGHLLDYLRQSTVTLRAI